MNGDAVSWGCTMDPTISSRSSEVIAVEYRPDTVPDACRYAVTVRTIRCADVSTTTIRRSTVTIYSRSWLRGTSRAAAPCRMNEGRCTLATTLNLSGSTKRTSLE